MNKQGLNPNLVLGAIVVLLTVVTGSVLIVVLSTTNPDSLLFRVGVVTAVSSTAVSAMVGLLVSGRANAAAVQAETKMVDVETQANGHRAELDVLQTEMQEIKAGNHGPGE